MHPARLIVCEKTGRWAAALRQVNPVSQPLVETRSLDGCWQELQASPASVLAVEATPRNLERLLERLIELRHQHPKAASVVLVPKQLENYQWLLREAGAGEVVFARRPSRSLLRFIARHLAAAPKPARTWKQRIWDRLPWK